MTRAICLVAALFVGSIVLTAQTELPAKKVLSLEAARALTNSVRALASQKQ